LKLSDKRAFADELRTTIQVLSGTIHPPKSMLKGFFEALDDLPLDKVLKALKQARRDQSGWCSPKSIRIMIEGNPERDEFFNYMHNFIARSQQSNYKHPIGIRVIRELGGSNVFSMSTNHDQKDLMIRWQRKWKEVVADSGANNESRTNHAPVSPGDNGVHGRGAAS
jgi:hypothetical protein